MQTIKCTEKEYKEILEELARWESDGGKVVEVFYQIIKLDECGKETKENYSGINNYILDISTKRFEK